MSGLELGDILNALRYTEQYAEEFLYQSGKVAHLVSRLKKTPDESIVAPAADPWSTAHL